MAEGANDNRSAADIETAARVDVNLLRTLSIAATRWKPPIGRSRRKKMTPTHQLNRTSAS
jgi:hypothetical protein